MTSERPMAGLKAWLITDDKIGMQVQVKGVADALGLAGEQRIVAPRALWRLASPWGPADPRQGVGRPGGPLGPPWPDVVLATGRLSIPFLRAVRRRAGLRTFSVVLQDPRTSADTADLIWVPQHDRRRGPNVITTLTAPHGFSPERIERLRSESPKWLADLPSPRVAVVLGGPNHVYRFTDADERRFAQALGSMRELGASFLVTPSRRSPRSLVGVVEAAIAGANCFVWDGRGDNPYPHFIAHADAFVVTGDSVNMTGEPAATGRPVWVFEPTGGSDKFHRFHESLRRHGATRSLPEVVSSLAPWTYERLDSARAIADEIERRWLARQRLMPGRRTGG